MKAALARKKGKTPSLADDMRVLGHRAREAARLMSLAPPEQKNEALLRAAKALRLSEKAILDANAADVSEAQSAGRVTSFLDRLTVDEKRIDAMASSLEEIAALPDPVAEIIAEWERPNGLKIARVRVPLGVLGVIYESRPNVTADAGALCLKSGNAVILRGGADSMNSARAIHHCLVQGLLASGLPESAIQFVQTPDRAAVGMMLSGLDGAIDVIVPRGGKSLVARVQAEARVPVFAHLEGVNHVYVHAAADLTMAREIVLNAKMRRTGVCGSAETLLVDEACADTHLPALIAALVNAGCEVRGDAAFQAADSRVKPAHDEDWGMEYLDAVISARVVNGMSDAIAHIAAYGSEHTDAIVTEDAAAAERFLREVDSAIVLWNASTQFADGGEFGMGAEIGIATGRFHARGPVGLEQLTTFKYVVRGAGQTRAP